MVVTPWMHFSSVPPSNDGDISEASKVDNKKIGKISILNIYDDDQSKYEGLPLVKPKYLYEHTQKTFQVKSEWTFI
jgi:hypothetical protein